MKIWGISLARLALAACVFLASAPLANATCDTDSPATCAVIAASATATLTPAAFSGASPSSLSVTNNCSAPIMVPMLNQTAWASFVGNKQSCAVFNCIASPWGVINNGSSVTAYQASTVACGSSCVSETRTCANGTLSGSYANNYCYPNACASCSSGTVSWGSCSGTAAAASSGGSVSVTNSASGYTGSATATCTNGSWSTSSTTCTASAGCASGTITWGSCSGTAAAASSGGSVSVTNSASGYSGSATATCTNGSWSTSGTTCSAAASCSAGTVSWNGACSGSVAAKASGSSVGVTNSVHGYSGSATATCTNGSWSTSGSCTAMADCASKTLTWGNCTGTASSGQYMDTGSVTNTNSGYSGSAATVCDYTGNWALSGSSNCDADCAATTLSWGGGCSGSAPKTSSGNTVNVTNTASGYTGLDQVACQNGSWLLVSSGCQASCPASGGCPVTNSGLSCVTYSRQSLTWVEVNCESKSCANYQTGASCSSGTWYGTISAYSTCGGTTGCFIGKTQITMADGSHKPIEELKIGDAVRGQSGINHVVAPHVLPRSGMLYGFNGGKAFVTGGHPFWTKDGWKAIDPALTPMEIHGVKATKLNIGDTLSLDDGTSFVVTSIDAASDSDATQVFNPSVDGDNTYYANGFLVHNKLCP